MLCNHETQRRRKWGANPPLLCNHERGDGAPPKFEKRAWPGFRHCLAKGGIESRGSLTMQLLNT